jgi:isocitrate lyase
MTANGSNGKNGNGNGNGNGNHFHGGAEWANDPRWAGITRSYSATDVLRLRGSIQIEYTLARLGAERLWNLMHSDDYVPALGAITGNQAIEMVQAGLKAIYGSGWQVAADGNTAGDVYPDQSLDPCDRAPTLV